MRPECYHEKHPYGLRRESVIASRRRGTTKRSSTTRKRSTTTRRPASKTPEHPAPSKGERVFLLDVPYEERTVAQHFGARYFSSEGWAYTGTSLPRDLERYRPKRYSWQAWQERTLLGEITATAPAPDPDPDTGTFILRRDQLQDVKKVLLARSLCQSAHLYIWDEPLNYIDLYARMQVEELILQYRPTLLFVEHDAAFCRAVATGTVTLQKSLTPGP